MAPGTNNQRAVPRYRTSCCRQGCLGLKEVFHKGCLRERHSGIDCNLPPKGKGPRCPGPLPWCGGAGLDLGLVAAGPELHRVAEVLAIAAVAFVLLALAALQDVRAAETDQQVVAGRTLEGVVGRRSGQDVVALAAGEVEVDPAAAAGLAALDVVGERRALGLLEVDDDVVAVTALGEAQAHVQVDAARSVGVDHRVGSREAALFTGVAVEVVVVQTTLDLVGTVATLDEVLTGVPLEVVGVVVPEEFVVAVVAVDGVVVLAAVEEVVVGTTVDGVVAFTLIAERVAALALERRTNAVVACTGVDRVVALTGDDPVVGRRGAVVVRTGVVDRVVPGVAPDVVVAGTRVDVVVPIVRVVVNVADLKVTVELVLTDVGGQAVVALATTQAVVVVVGDGARVGQGVVPVLAEQIVEALATLDGVVSATGLLVVDVGEVTEQIVVVDAAVQVVVAGIAFGVVVVVVDGCSGVIDCVVAVAAEVLVVSVLGVHRVVAAIAEEVVVLIVTVDGVAGLRPVDVDEPVQDVGAVAGCRTGCQVDGHASCRVAVVDGVVVSAACQVVVTGAALDAVAAATAIDRVVPGAPSEEVVIAETDALAGTGPAEDGFDAAADTVVLTGADLTVVVAAEEDVDEQVAVPLAVVDDVTTVGTALEVVPRVVVAVEVVLAVGAVALVERVGAVSARLVVVAVATDQKVDTAAGFELFTSLSNVERLGLVGRPLQVAVDEPVVEQVVSACKTRQRVVALIAFEIFAVVGVVVEV